MSVKHIVNGHEIHILNDDLLDKTICLCCFKRTARIMFKYYENTDYILNENDATVFINQSCPMTKWFSGSRTGCYYSPWCLECLLRCPQLDSETRQFLKTIFNNCPSDEELKKLTDLEELERQRDLEEKQCCCKKHLRICCHQSSLSFDEKNPTYLPSKMRELLDIIDCPEKLGKWLIWVGDDETRNEQMYRLICQSDQIPTHLRAHLQRLIIYAIVFKTRTHCHHDLPRPYTNCICNFSLSHDQRIIQDLYDMCILSKPLDD